MQNSNKFFMSYQDITDVLIRPESMHKFKKIMIESGYSQNISAAKGKLYVVNKEQIDSFEAQHYELFPFTKIIEMPELGSYRDYISSYLTQYPFIIENDKVFYGVEFDPHDNVSHGIKLEDIWSFPQEFHVGDTLAFAPNNEVLGWFMPARFYHETMVLAKHSARMLSDLIAMVSTRSLDYPKILLAAKKYGLQPSLYYVYRFLSDFIGLKMPRGFLSDLSESSSFYRSFRDWGDFVPKILGERVSFHIIQEKAKPRAAVRK